MLAGPDPLVILYVPCDSTQDDLLHQLPRHREGNRKQNHRITESYRLEKTFKIIESNHKPNTAKNHHYTMSLSTSSKRPLNTSRDGDSTTSLGSLFQCLITLSVKKNFLISSLNLPWRNLRRNVGMTWRNVRRNDVEHLPISKGQLINT
ncbi:hypothetical protein QYF61_000987 [Mycteria americana]|uniref:Uncharacterized protein n=1 Tax=Mycteria americana TaxID=33587 RepID=A0AAN7S1L1_MYCAM|nr:hypothetical protein QYF61_000987 [Mycteria americana]